MIIFLRFLITTISTHPSLLILSTVTSICFHEWNKLTLTRDQYKPWMIFGHYHFVIDLVSFDRDYTVSGVWYEHINKLLFLSCSAISHSYRFVYNSIFSKVACLLLCMGAVALSRPLDADCSEVPGEYSTLETCIHPRIYIAVLIWKSLCIFNHCNTSTLTFCCYRWWKNNLYKAEATRNGFVDGRYESYSRCSYGHIFNFLNANMRIVFSHPLTWKCMRVTLQLGVTTARMALWIYDLDVTQLLQEWFVWRISNGWFSIYNRRKKNIFCKDLFPPSSNLNSCLLIERKKTIMRSCNQCKTFVMHWKHDHTMV